MPYTLCTSPLYFVSIAFEAAHDTLLLEEIKETGHHRVQDPQPIVLYVLLCYLIRTVCGSKLFLWEKVSPTLRHTHRLYHALKINMNTCYVSVFTVTHTFYGKPLLATRPNARISLNPICMWVSMPNTRCMGRVA